MDGVVAMKHLAAFAAGLLVVSGVCCAQSAPSPSVPDKPNPEKSSGSQPVSPNGKKPAVENGKLFGVMPNYSTVDAASAPPLAAGEKFKLALRNIGIYTFVFAGVRAGVDQALDNKEGYGQGAEGYGKRYGADLADRVSNGLFVTGVFPSLFHQDPRYFRKSEGGGFSRVGYAVSRVLITRQDSGKKAFNFSELMGNAVSSGLSTTYYPEGERTGGDFAVRAGVQFGFDAGFNIVREFYPDFTRRFWKRSKASRSTTP
jgi:hypothetical protein